MSQDRLLVSLRVVQKLRWELDAGNLVRHGCVIAPNHPARNERPSNPCAVQVGSHCGPLGKTA